MQNLNDYYYFVQVVKFQGFTKASEALSITKSKLSRHISELEERLSVRLIQRNTRKFAVTDIGQQFYEHCLKILENVQDAENFIHSTLKDELCGTIKITCPVALVEFPVGRFIAEFMEKHLDVQVNLIASNERMDIIEQGIDLAIRVRNLPLENSDLIVRDLDVWEHALVASPKLFENKKVPSVLDEIRHFPSIGFNRVKHFIDFHHSQNKQVQQIELTPRLRTDSFSAMKAAVLGGVGLASIPKVFIRKELKSGELIHICPEWELSQGVIHVAYASRQGMLPAVRELLNYLIERFHELDVEKCEVKGA
jgi:DNA-binding transcriptional LysR family regulator